MFVFALAIGILAPVTFSLTQGNTVAVQTTTVFAQTAAQEKSDAAVYGNIGSCGIYFGSMGNCLAYIFYFIPFYVGGGILNVSARFLDFTATLTLSSKMFSSAGFLETGWALMRDFANMFFIFILLYIALCIMLGIKAGGADPKHMIVSVVLIAIVINFSMFVTDVIIDTSNTLALVFYNQITIKPDPLVASSTLPADTVGQALQTGTPGDTVPPKQIGLALASSFHPQAFTDPGFWTQLKGNGTTVPPSRMILILFIMGVLYFVVAWSFLVAAFSFMGRMVELFVLIIFSPIAFVSFIVPGMRGMDRFGWSTWWKSLVKTAFAAPIYFLLILLITLILNAGLFKPLANPPTGDDGWIIILVGSVLVPAVFLWIMLTEATKYAQKASGTVGEKLGGMASTAVKGIGVATGSAVLGVATGGAAAIGRQTIGRTAERFTSGTMGNKFLKWSEGTGVGAFLARKTVEVAKDTQKASFDVRQTGVGQKFAATTGMKMDSISTLSIAAAKGGRDSQKARQAAENERKRVIMQNKNASKPINREIDDRKVKLEVAKGKLAGVSDTYDKAKAKETEKREEYNVARHDADQARNDFKDLDKERAVLQKEEDAANALLAAAQALEQKASQDRITNPGAASDKAYADALAKRKDAEQSAAAKHTAKTTFVDSDAYKNAKKNSEGKGTTADNLKKELEGLHGETKTARKDYEHEKHGVHEIEHGKHLDEQNKAGEKLILRDDHGKARRYEEGHPQAGQIMRDETKVATKEDAMADMSIHQLEAASSNAENSHFKENMLNGMKNRYKDASAKRDNLGNITTMNSSGMVKERTRGLQLKQAVQAATVSAAPAFILGTAVAGPIGGLAAALTSMAIAGTLEAKKNKNNLNLDSKQNAANTMLKNLKEGKPTQKHDADKDNELTTILSKPVGAVGEIIGKSVSALGVKTSGGGGHAKKASGGHGDDHGAAKHDDHGAAAGGHGDAHGGGHAPKGGH